MKLLVFRIKPRTYFIKSINTLNNSMLKINELMKDTKQKYDNNMTKIRGELFSVK